MNTHASLHMRTVRRSGIRKLICQLPAVLILMFIIGSSVFPSIASPVAVPQESVPRGLEKADWQGIRAAYEAGRHEVQPVAGRPNEWQARNPGQQWRTTFDGRGFLTEPNGSGWQWGLELRSYGLGDERSVMGKATDAVRAEGQRITYDWDAVVQEWWVNDQRGLEHGFTVKERPAGPPDAELRFELGVRGSLRANISAETVHFRDANGAPVVTYSGLRVWDSDGKVLSSRFEAAAAGCLALCVDQQCARYPITVDPLAQQAYLKPAPVATTQVDDGFGFAVAVDGDRVVVGAPLEDTNAAGVDGAPNENSPDSGATYIFRRVSGVWSLEAFLKPSNVGTTIGGDQFGYAVAVSGDTVVVGGRRENSGSTGVGSTADETALNSGAAYVYFKYANGWSLQAYLKPAAVGTTQADDEFGSSVAISGDTIVVGAPREDSSSLGVNSVANESAADAGAAYVFTRSGAAWSQQAYLKPAAVGVDQIGDRFGKSVGVSGDTIIVGAPEENGGGTGVNSTPDGSALNAGAAYIFSRSGTAWSQQAYLKPGAVGTWQQDDFFGNSVAISGDTAVVGAPLEDGGAAGVNSAPNENSLDSGAAFVFTRIGSTWSQQAYLKIGNAGAANASDQFGTAVAISGDTIVVGVPYEDGGATGVNGGPDESAFRAGAACVFFRSAGVWSQQAYLKPGAVGTTQVEDEFGYAVAVAGDTVLVGAPGEDSGATDVNGIPDESASRSGAATLFTRSGGTWSQQAWLKTSAVRTGQAGDNFGNAVSISGDTIVVGAPFENSRTTGVNTSADELAPDAGAAFVFVRSGGVWTQEAYLKPAAVGTTQAQDLFGWSVAVSGDTIVIGAPWEDSGSTGVNSAPDENAATSGAVYVFTRSGGVWSQQAYLKPAAVGSGQAGDRFGESVAVDGDTLITGAPQEDSSTTGVNGSANESGANSGAAYIFTRSGTTWSQQAWLKPGNVGTTQAADNFGASVALSGDTAVVGADQEDSSSIGVDSAPDESAGDAGAAFVFTRSGGVWSQQAYLKPAAVGTSQAGDLFGNSVAISGDTIVVGAEGEDSSTTGVNTTADELAANAGAAYVFTRSGNVWSQQAYLKLDGFVNSQQSNAFGGAVAVAGDLIVIGAYGEDGLGTGINSGTPVGGSSSSAGAAFVFARLGITWSQQAYLKPVNVGNTQAGDLFGISVAIAGDTVIAGAPSENSSTAGVNTTPDETAPDSGAAHVFSGFSPPGPGSPTNISLSNSSIPENAGANALVGTLSTTDPDPGQTHTYSLVSGTYGADNAAFNISGNQLRLTASADFETKATYSIRIQTDDGQGGTLSKPFTITITNANDAPIDLALSNNSIPEGAGANASVGTLSSSDPDTGQTHTYSLVPGAGGQDNSAFNISGSQLRLTNSANYEVQSVYSVRIRTTDNGTPAAYYEEIFTIAVTNFNVELLHAVPPQPTGIQTNAILGWSVAMEGAYVAAGAFEDDTGGVNSGVVKVFDAASGSLLFVIPNPAPFLEDKFGFSIAISGAKLVVGVPSDNTGGIDSGSAYVYDLAGATPTVPILAIHNPEPGTPSQSDGFGAAVAISGDRVVVGAYAEDTGGNNAGSAYVYDLTSPTPSVAVATLINPSSSPDADLFGRAVSISGTRVVVGADGEDFGASDSGSAYVYDLAGAAPTVPIATLNNPSPAIGEYFGASVAISGTRVVVGARGDSTGASNTGSAYVFDVSSATPTTPTVTLNNPAPAVSDSFGASVAISGSRVVVGAHGDDAGGVDAGSAYVFDVAGTTQGTPVATLNNPGPAASDLFGFAVAISGARIAIGAHNDDTAAENSGSVYLYDLSGGAPTLPTTTLNDPGPGGYYEFGRSVAISGNRMVVGAPSDDTGGTDAGRAFVYDLAGSTPLTPIITLANPAPAASDNFGRTVAISGNRIIVGEPFDDTGFANSGKAYVYDVTSATPATPVLTISNPGPQAQDVFGSSVAISGGFAVVGAPGDSTGASGAGSIYVYDLAGATPGTPLFTINNPAPAAGDQFGKAVSISGLRVVAGATGDDTGASDSGSAYVYNLAGATPTAPVVTLTNPTPAASDLFGDSVAISGIRVVIGVWSDDTGGANSGSAYVYDVSSATPTVPVLTINNPAPAANDRFGGSAALSGAMLVVGAPNDYAGGGGTGAAYVFDLAGTAPGIPADTLSKPSPLVGDQFGYSVAVDGTTFAIGAYLDSAFMASTGYAYVFGLPPNSPPTDIALSAAAVPENSGGNAGVGTLSAADSDAGQIHNFSFASGVGDADNGAFNISGNELRLNASADFEVKNSYNVRIRATDNGTPALSYEEAFSVTITNVNEMPSFIVGANQTIASTTAVQSVTNFIAAFDDGDSTVAQALTFNTSVLSGAGLFTTPPAINSSGSLTYTPNGTVGTATVSVTLTDDTSIGGAGTALTTAAQTFSITLTPEPDINLVGNGNAIPNGAATPQLANHTDFGGIGAAGNATVVRLFSIQNTSMGVLTLTGTPRVVVGGANASDFAVTAAPASPVAANSSTTFEVTFNPSGLGLRTAALSILNNDPDKNPYSFAIQGTGLGSAPSDVSLTSASVPENNSPGVLIGTLSATDPDVGESHTFALVAGAGDTDNAAFTISGSTLSINGTADFEVKSSYAIRVRATDNGTPPADYEEAMLISVTNVNEMPGFTIGANQTIVSTGSPQTVPGFITVFDDGDSTVTQALAFNVSVAGGAGLFTTAPAIGSNGTLSYTPNGTVGTATLNVTLTDDTSIGGAGTALTTAPQSFTITTTPSSNADLAALSLSSGGLTPAFAAATTTYSSTVTLPTTTVTATPLHPAATLQVQINGGGFSALTPGSPSSPLSLNVGANTIDVRATAQDGTTQKIYTVAVTRSVSAPAGDLDSLNLDIAGSEVRAIAVQPDGAIIIGGDFSSVLGVTRNNIARINPGGTLDSGFNPGTNSTVTVLAVQADGKIVLGGGFSSAGGATRSNIARVNADGTIDTGFNPGASSNVRGLAIQADGKIVLGGNFTTVAGATRSRIARLNPDGTIDAAFNPNSGGNVFTVAVQPDGKVLIGGNFSTLGGSSRSNIARVNSDGSLDAGFNPGATGGSVSCVVVQPDGKIIVGGAFTSAGGAARGRIARLNADGSLDTGFNPNANNTVTGIALQTDGRILLCGDFTALGGTTRNRIGRLNADGSVDTGFNPNANGSVNGAILQADGGILIGGGFSTLQPNGAASATTRNRFARLLNDAAAQTLATPDNTQMLWTRSGSSPEVEHVTFELSTDGGASYAPIPGTPARVGATPNWQLTGISLPENGHIRAKGRASGAFQNGSSGLVETVVAFNLGAPEISISGNGIAIADGDGTPDVADHTDFGSVVSAGSGTTMRTFTIANAGPGSLTLSGAPLVTVSGPNAGDFSVTTQPAAVIASGAATTFNVTFDPSDPGLRSATLSIANDDADENPYTFSIHGMGGNSDPSFSGYTLYTPMNTAANAAATALLTRASDPDGGPLTISSTPAASARGGGVSLSAGTLTYTPPSGFTGLDVFALTVSDAHGGSVTGTVTVNVTAIAGQNFNPAQIALLPDGRAVLLFLGTPGLSYRIQRSSDLVNWTTLSTQTAPGDGTLPWLDASPPPRACYRAVVP